MEGTVMDKTWKCKDMWANIFFFLFFFGMTENSGASTKLPSQESAVAKMQSLFLRLGRNPASQTVSGVIYNLTRWKVSSASWSFHIQHEIILVCLASLQSLNGDWSLRSVWWIPLSGLLHLRLNLVWWLCSAFNLFNLKTDLYFQSR